MPVGRQTTLSLNPYYQNRLHGRSRPLSLPPYWLGSAWLTQDERSGWGGLAYLVLAVTREAASTLTMVKGGKDQ